MLRHDDVQSAYVVLRLPCTFLAALAIIALAADRSRRFWPEMVFVSCGLTMSLVGGAIDGMPRFLLSLFPVFLVLGRLHRIATPLWYSWLVGSVLIQSILIVDFVAFCPPAP